MYADELSPEDIFNMFFGMPPTGGRHGGGGFHRTGGFHRRPGGGVHVHTVGNGGILQAPRAKPARARGTLSLRAPAAQVLPILLLGLFSLLSSITIGDSQNDYAFTAHEPYTLPRQTVAARRPSTLPRYAPRLHAAVLPPRRRPADSIHRRVRRAARARRALLRRRVI